MGYNEEYEQEIDLKDLMFHILYRWRSVLLVAVLACALAIGYAGMYNGMTLPSKRAGVQGKLNEQQLMLEGLEEGQPADPIQSEMAALQEELDGLEEYSLVKYGIIGLVIGLFGMAFCHAMCYVLSDKMRGERELLERYGYHLLGTFSRRRKGKLLKGLDKFLEKKEGVSGRTSDEEVNGIIAANITNLAKDGGLFLVTGTVEMGRLQKIMKAIVPLLQKNVMVVVGADMNQTAGTLEALGECDAVILVEERGQSLRGKIQKEHENIAALDKNVVGYVVL